MLIITVIIIHWCEPSRPSYLLVMLYEDLNHNVLELDVHDGGHRLLLWAEQSRPEDHAQVGDRHQVVLVVAGNTVGHEAQEQHLKVSRQRRVKEALSLKRLLTPHPTFRFLKTLHASSKCRSLC